MADSPHLPDREIHLLLDGALDERAAQAARAHLTACASCALRLETQARLFAAIESWEETPPAHDLVPRVLAGLRPPATPVGLSWAVALQAGVALLIAALLWPLVAGLAQSIRLPAIPAPGLIETWLAETSSWTASIEASLLDSLNSAQAWLRMPPDWIAIWPLVVAGAALVAVVGNSILLSRSAAGSRPAGLRRL